MSKFIKKLFRKKDKTQTSSVAGEQSGSKSAGSTASKPAAASSSSSSSAAAAPNSKSAGAPASKAAGSGAGAGAGAGAAAGAGAGAAAGAGAGSAATAAKEPGSSAAAAAADPKANVAQQTTGSSSGPKIAIIGHSLWGHIDALVKEAAEGVKSTGATVEIFSFGETLPPEVLEKMHAQKQQAYPAITPEKLKEFDGYLLAAATRFGRLPAQVDTFFDATGGLWATGGLLGKFAGLITSTGGQHGGQETTFLSTLPWLVHHGINYVPIGYQFEQLSNTDVVEGGTPWGASTLSKADGSRQVNSEEKIVASKQGAYFAQIVGTYKKGLTA